MGISGLTLVEQFVYPRGALRPALYLTDHAANRQQQPKLVVDDLDVAYAPISSAVAAPLSMTAQADPETPRGQTDRLH